MQKTLHYILIA